MHEEFSYSAIEFACDVSVRSDANANSPSRASRLVIGESKVAFGESNGALLESNAESFASIGKAIAAKYASAASK